MEKPKKVGSNEPHRLKPKLVSKLVPFLVFGAVIATTLALNYTGYINLEDLVNFPLEIKNHATIGVQYEGFDFAPKLIPMLNPEWNGDRNGYTFYLGSGIGFPPMGMILGPDGILRGTPTGRGGNFEVCVKDVGGNSKCIKVHLTVDSSSEENINPPNYNCPKTSLETSTPCGTNQTGGAGVGGVYIYANCTCPSDTTDSGTKIVAAGGPYKICTCKGIEK